MRTHLDCFPCFLRQTVIALGQYPETQALHHEIMKEVVNLLGDVDLKRPPAFATTVIHRKIRERLGRDPFQQIKRTYNDVALGLYEELRERVRNSPDPLHTAARLAISGNIIDFAIFTSVDIERSIERALEGPIAVDDYGPFHEEVSGAGRILYLLDNSGEIVFDRLLIEELTSRGVGVKAVVKGSPVLNDVTLEDAIQVDLHRTCDVIDNGSDAIGTVVEWTSPEFRAEFEAAELVISKGQANFETLSDTAKRTYFLFQSKCDVVSKELGLSPGSMLLKKS
jgi:uncharacterized protein with ATP-grasp and redox domains